MTLAVVLPVYNAERFLEACLTSLQKQTLTDFTVLCLDDGSTDRSPELMERFAAKDGRFRVHSFPHRGLVATLNDGLSLALGLGATLIARMDADDVCHPGRLGAQVAFLSRPENSAIDLLGTAVEVFYAGTAADGEEGKMEGEEGGNGDGKQQTQRRERVLVQPAQPAQCLFSMFFYCCVAHPTVMMRASLLERARARTEAVSSPAGPQPPVSFYRSAFPRCEDYDAWLRLLPHVRMANLPQPLLRLRKHAGNVSGGISSSSSSASSTLPASSSSPSRSASAFPDSKRQALLAVARRLSELGLLEPPTVSAFSSSSTSVVDSSPSSASPSCDTATADEATLPKAVITAVTELGKAPSASSSLTASSPGRGEEESRLVRLAAVLQRPEEGRSIAELDGAFRMILRIEAFCCSVPWVSDADRGLISSSATARLGEVATLALQMDPLAPAAQDMLRQWMQRSKSKASLVSLLSASS